MDKKESRDVGNRVQSMASYREGSCRHSPCLSPCFFLHLFAGMFLGMLLVSFPDAPKVSDNLGIDVKLLCSRPARTLTLQPRMIFFVLNGYICMFMNGASSRHQFSNPTLGSLAICTV